MTHSGTRVYRALVHLYPRSFRDDYAADIVQHFTDLVADRGVLRAWRLTIVDLAVTVPRYRLETVMSTRRATAVLTAIAGLLTAAAAVVLIGSLVPLGLFLLLVAIGLAVAERSQLARSMRPSSPDHRRRFRIGSVVWTLVAIGTLVVGMIDLGGEEHWPADRLLIYNLLFFGSILAAIGSLVMGLRRPQTV